MLIARGEKVTTGVYPRRMETCHENLEAGFRKEVDHGIPLEAIVDDLAYTLSRIMAGTALAGLILIAGPALPKNWAVARALSLLCR